MRMLVALLGLEFQRDTGLIERRAHLLRQFFATKKKYDPIGLFTNKFHEKYGI